MTERRVTGHESAKDHCPRLILGESGVTTASPVRYTDFHHENRLAKAAHYISKTGAIDCTALSICAVSSDVPGLSSGTLYRPVII